MYLVTGSNIFGQWMTKGNILSNFQTLKYAEGDTQFNLDRSKISYIGWSYNVFQIGSNFYISGFYGGQEKQFHKITLPENCIGVTDTNLKVIGNDYNLMLINVETHNMWLIDLELKDDIKKITFNTEIALEEGVSKRSRKSNEIVKIMATNDSCLCMTEGGLVYHGLLPSLLDTRHCKGKVSDVQCGHEHCMLLTDTGRVYTWGNGRRLQLGHGDLSILESPTEVEALSGIKIIKISCGGWHCLALSEFGDLYAWGWNDTGQLGIKSQPENVKDNGFLKTDGLKSYSIPTLVDLFDENDKNIILNVKDMDCGSKHSVIILEDNSVWCTGNNKYGQLGFSPEINPTVSYFRKSFQTDENFKINCGSWCTVLQNKCASTIC